MTERLDGGETQLRRYLLGELTEEEAMRMEERLLEDAEYLTQLQLVEADLMDEYARGELAKREAERFEQYFMAAPERQRDVRFAKALHRLVAEQAAHERAPAPVLEARRASAGWWSSVVAWLRLPQPTAGWAAASAALLLLIGTIIWVSLERARQRRAEEQLRAAQTTPQPAGVDDVEVPPSPVPSATQNEERDRPSAGNEGDQGGTSGRDQSNVNSAPSPRRPVRPTQPAPHERQERPLGERPSVMAFMLLPGRMRNSGATKTLRLSAETEQVRLELGLEDDSYQRYRAEVRTAEGREITRRDNLPTRQMKEGKVVVVILPARQLSAGDYVVNLSGAPPGGSYEMIETYQFRVAPR